METPTYTHEELLAVVNSIAPEAVALAQAQLSAQKWKELAEDLDSRLNDGGTES